MGTMPDQPPIAIWTGLLPVLPGAACRDSVLGPDAWFSSDIGRMLAAQRVCAACPVAAECLAFAVDHGISDGLWGGRLPHERGRVPRRHRAAG